MKVSPRSTTRGAVSSVVRRPKHSRPRRGRRLTRRSVTKMLAVMTEQSPDSNKDPVEAFLSSGRTGRRNALADIRGEHAATSTSNLPECLEKLSTKDNPSDMTDAQGSATNPGSATSMETTGTTSPERPEGGSQSIDQS
ncbi:hypothetical protein C0J52_15570 [Blattella germanica]|nr:hypothetical protein C0J52_15570 [Blattella germanica]